LRIALLFIFVPYILFANAKEATERVQARLLIEDFTTASKEANTALQQFPKDESLWEVYIQSLAKIGNENEMIRSWKTYAILNPKAYENRELLEAMSWGVLDQGANSSLPMIRTISLLGAFFAQDAKGVSLLNAHLKDSNSQVRAITVELASNLRDAQLCDSILKMLRNEQVWKVRLNLIKAIGSMKITSAKPDLIAIVADDNSTAEEKVYAIQSLVNLLETAERSEVKKLATSSRAGLRTLACQIVNHFTLGRDLDLMINLLQDHCSEVRMSSLIAIGRLNVSSFNGIPIANIAEGLLRDPNINVAITAAWLLTLHDKFRGQEAFKPYLSHELKDVRILASAALASCGKYSMPLSRQVFSSNSDPYVKMNLAISLIGQREVTQEATEALYDGFTLSKERWMWKETEFGRALTSSDIKYSGSEEEHPEAVHQLAQLEILNIMAMMKHPKAQEAITRFLLEKTWGITGTASAMLLTECDESAQEIVIKLLNHPSHKVKVQAALILSVWGRDEKAIAVLQEGYLNADRDMKIRILEGIARIGSHTSIPFLVDKMNDQHQTLRIVAACALLQCLYH
jgi:HEAT repeat protein